MFDRQKIFSLHRQAQKLYLLQRRLAVTNKNYEQILDSIFHCAALRIIHGRLNASWKICSLVVNGQSFLVIDGYLLNLFQIASNFIIFIVNLKLVWFLGVNL